MNTRAIQFDPSLLSRRSGTMRIGTRSSRLALWQANLVAELLDQQGVGTELVGIETTGDIDLHTPIDDLGPAAPFADEIESALLNGEIDLAVHSYKDLSATQTAGLKIAAVLERGDPRDAVVSRDFISIEDLPSGAVVGTCSARRAAQIAYLYPHLATRPLRGTVPQRVRHLRSGAFDAVILAAAGLQRLGMEAEITDYLPVAHFVPAPAQAALAIQVRSGNHPLIDLLTRLEHRPSRLAVELERDLLARYERRRGTAVAAHAKVGEATEVRVRLLTTAGLPIFEGVFTGSNRDCIFRRACEHADAALAAFDEVTCS